MHRPYLVLEPGCGIGNVVLKLAGFKEWSCSTTPPVVLCRPEDLPGIRVGIVDDAFEFVTKPPDDGIPVPDGHFCTLGTLRYPSVVADMRRIVRTVDDITDCDCDAAFCIRTSDPVHDGDAVFMNSTAVESMKAEMTKFDRVLVFTNDATNCEGLPPHARVYSETHKSERNVADHWKQWHALARAPVVYHGVSGKDGSITSTFAPVAVAYGGTGVIVGVDNEGRVLHGGTLLCSPDIPPGITYHW